VIVFLSAVSGELKLVKEGNPQEPLDQVEVITGSIGFHSINSKSFTWQVKVMQVVSFAIAKNL
jgi:hypothetical protein